MLVSKVLEISFFFFYKKIKRIIKIHLKYNPKTVTIINKTSEKQLTNINKGGVRLSYKIITNNPSVKKDYDEVDFVEGSFEEVLLTVRNLVHSGYDLISHPLGASLRMFFSPYRSIIVGDEILETNEMHIQIIENSIENYKKHMKERKPDTANKDDYALIDAELLKSSMEEYKSLNMLNNK